MILVSWSSRVLAFNGGNDGGREGFPEEVKGVTVDNGGDDIPEFTSFGDHEGS